MNSIYKFRKNIHTFAISYASCKYAKSLLVFIAAFTLSLAY